MRFESRFQSRYGSRFTSRYGREAATNYRRSSAGADLSWSVAGSDIDLWFEKSLYQEDSRRYTSLGAVPAFAYTRTGSRAAARLNGDLPLFTPDSPRITDRGLQVNPAATNLLPRSNDGTQWTTVGATTVDSGESGFAGMKRVRVASSGGLANRVARRDLSLTSGQAYQIKVWFEEGTSGRLGIRCRSIAASSLSTVSGSIGTVGATAEAGGTITNIVQGVQFGSVRFVEFTLTPNITATDWEVGVGPDTTTSGQDVVLLGAQMEVGTLATPYVPTSTSSATAGADVATITGSYSSGDIVRLTHSGGVAESTWGIVESAGAWDLSEPFDNWAGVGFIQRITIIPVAP
jgi:hypothetical protein